eukprot:XP_001709675.1 Hypothetical protein GL50803_11922 [Giardia lamblia ATCC 50803]
MKSETVKVLLIFDQFQYCENCSVVWQRILYGHVIVLQVSYQDLDPVWLQGSLCPWQWTV